MPTTVSFSVVRMRSISCSNRGKQIAAAEVIPALGGFKR
jgi:hypothetical protein